MDYGPRQLELSERQIVHQDLEQLLILLIAGEDAQFFLLLLIKGGDTALLARHTRRVQRHGACDTSTKAETSPAMEGDATPCSSLTPVSALWDTRLASLSPV